jgi:hypothetical protein
MGKVAMQDPPMGHRTISCIESGHSDPASEMAEAIIAFVKDESR